jgi:hypothetical protein
MVTAIVLALVVSATAALVLNMTFRRFELSAFRTDRSVAGGTSEAGFQYVFARMDKDRAYNDPAFPAPPAGNGFRETVQRKRNSQGAGAIAATGAANDAAEYVVTCHDAAATDENQLVPAIHMGPAATGKHLTTRIRFFTQADINALPNSPLKTLLANRPYKVRSFSNFGTGEQ